MCASVRRERGLTLVELLVSMAIMGFVMTLVAQAVFQVGHIVRVADESVLRLGERWRTGWSLIPVMSNLVAPREGGDRPFVGGAEQFEAYTTASLAGESLGVQPIAVRLRPDGRGGTELLYRPGVEGEEVAIAAWPGRVEFRYRSFRGEELAQWPPWTRAARDTVVLPSVVALVSVGAGNVAMAFAVPAPAERQLPPGISPIGGGAGS